MTNVPNFGAASLLGVAEHWTSIQTVFHYCLLIEELLRWLPVRDQSLGQCCPTPSSVRRTVGVCESLPEHCAILLCIELHLVWVVLLVERLVSTEIVRLYAKLKSLALCFHSDADKMSCVKVVFHCHISLKRSTLANSAWYCGGFGAAGDLGFSRCLV